MSSTIPPQNAPRRRRTLDEARSLASAWRASGMTKEGWCREQGLLRSSLESCLIRVMQAEAAGPTGFIAVTPPSKRTWSPTPLAVTDAGDERTVRLSVFVGEHLRVTGLDLAGVVELARRLGVAVP